MLNQIELNCSSLPEIYRIFYLIIWSGFSFHRNFNQICFSIKSICINIIWELFPVSCHKYNFLFDIMGHNEREKTDVHFWSNMIVEFIWSLSIKTPLVSSKLYFLNTFTSTILIKWSERMNKSVTLWSKLGVFTSHSDVRFNEHFEFKCPKMKAR